MNSVNSQTSIDQIVSKAVNIPLDTVQCADDSTKLEFFSVDSIDALDIHCKIEENVDDVVEASTLTASLTDEELLRRAGSLLQPEELEKDGRQSFMIMFMTIGELRSVYKTRVPAS